MGSQEVWDSGIVCRRKEANREALDGGTSFFSASLPSSWMSQDEQLSHPSPLTRTSFETVSPNTASFAVSLPGTQI